MKTPGALLMVMGILLLGDVHGRPGLVQASERGYGGGALVDTSEFCTTEGIVKSWKTINLDRPASYNDQSYSSIRVLRYYKCGDREMVSVQSVAYEGKDGSGKVIDRQTATFSELLYEPIPPDSASQMELVSACNQTQ